MNKKKIVKVARMLNQQCLVWLGIGLVSSLYLVIAGLYLSFQNGERYFHCFYSLADFHFKTTEPSWEKEQEDTDVDAVVNTEDAVTKF